MTIPADNPSDSLMHQLIETVRDNTEKTVLVRSDVNTVVSHIYQRIVEIERQLLAEAKERPQRQRELDRSIGNIKDRLDNQDDILEGQDQKLDTLFVQQETVIRAGRRRFWLMVGILVACLFVAARVAGVWLL